MASSRVVLDVSPTYSESSRLTLLDATPTSSLLALYPDCCFRTPRLNLRPPLSHNENRKVAGAAGSSELGGTWVIRRAVSYFPKRSSVWWSAATSVLRSSAGSSPPRPNEHKSSGKQANEGALKASLEAKPIAAHTHPERPIRRCHARARRGGANGDLIFDVHRGGMNTRTCA